MINYGMGVSGILRVLSKSFLESNVPWQMRYTLIQLLMKKYKLNPREISAHTHIKDKELKKYIPEPEIPDYFKKIAVEKGYGTLLNAIYRDINFSDETKLILYDMGTTEKHRLTEEKFRTLKRYLKVGNNLTPDLFNLKKQITEIVEPKEYIESELWNMINHKYSMNLFDGNTDHQHPLQ